MPVRAPRDLFWPYQGTNVHARCAVHAEEVALARVHETGVSAHHVHEAESLRQSREPTPRASIQAADAAAPSGRAKKRRHQDESLKPKLNKRTSETYRAPPSFTAPSSTHEAQLLLQKSTDPNQKTSIEQSPQDQSNREPE